MNLDRKNYHSKEASDLFWGSTQYKNFMECEAKAMAILSGDWEMNSSGFLAGQYLDAYFEGDIEEFKATHPELYDSRKGTLKVAYDRDFNKAIQAIESDPIMLNLMSGEQQRIFTGEIAGSKFKVMIDSLHNDVAVDRKYMASFRHKWSGGEQVEWWSEFGYDIQGAIYSEILRQNGYKIPFDLVAISKEDIPDKAWVRFSEQTLASKLEEIKYNMPRLEAVKSGMLDPKQCGFCDYCTNKKKLTEPLEV